MLKRYLVFAWNEYYPYGGAFDYQKSFDKLDDAKEWLKEQMPNWGHVFCQNAGKIIYSITFRINPISGIREILTEEI